ncbi:MAG TPA: hypothetical protein VMT53_24660 [Terriglobales bacterium]|nr:hypothetical protein [Terriglobales bacterium]
MKHILILLSLALSATICAAQQAPTADVNAQDNKATATEGPAQNAQTPGSPGKQEQSAAGQSIGPSSSPSNSARQTISGCLNQSGTAYTLTDAQTGTVYQLSGNTSHLSSHVGHEMQITGKAANRNNENATGAASQNSSKPYPFLVSTTKHLGDECGPSPATANGPSL